ncbi:MAG: hypothetical protein AAGA25_16020 [Planctomycetota bacterium]
MAGENKGKIVAGNFDLLHDQFDLETDRAAVILAASILDDLLKTVLSNRLVVNASGHDTLFDGPNAPLGSFSSRIELSYRTGVVSSTFARDLHLIRKIRNEFAHAIAGCDFKEPRVQNRISELIRGHKKLVTSEEHEKNIRPTPNRSSFLWVVSWMCFYLEQAAQEIGRINSCTEEFGYTDFRGSNHPLWSKSCSRQVTGVERSEPPE